MEVVEEWIAAGRQRPYIDDRALSGRYDLFAVELGALEFGRHLACVLNAQLEFDAGLHIQCARLETIVVDRQRVTRLLRRYPSRYRRQHQRRGNKNSSVPKRHRSTHALQKGRPEA